MGRIGVAEEDEVLPAANLRTRLSVGDDAHALDTFGDAHLWIQDGTVSSDVHTAYVIGGERDVLQLYPRFTCSELVLNAGGVVCQHFVDDNVLGALAHCHRSTEKEQSAQE